MTPDGRTANLLRRAFASACEEHDIRGSLKGDEDALELLFHPQENADSGLLLEAFRTEMAKAGVPLEDICQPSHLDAAAAARAASALQTAVGRLRILLIEYNSYLSGGLDWSFTTGPDAMRERGLAVYRFPASGAVDVTAGADHIRIAYEKADHGEVTSSGFYAPTRIRGNFEITLRYRIQEWRAGPQSASLALFVQNEPSSLRYYSQRRSCQDAPHEILANFNNQVLSEPRPLTAPEGAFRIARQGNLITTAHREGSSWVVLGKHRGDPPDDVVLGSKLWTSAQAGPFDVQLFDLEVTGEIPSDQLPPVPLRPDPRGL